MYKMCQGYYRLKQLEIPELVDLVEEATQESFETLGNLLAEAHELVEEMICA